MFRFFGSYHRRRLREVRRERREVAAAVQRMGCSSDPDGRGRRQPPIALADPLRELLTDLSRVRGQGRQTHHRHFRFHTDAS